jgi:signal transduction histidine kinase
MHSASNTTNNQAVPYQLEQLAALGAHSAGLAHELRNAFVPVKTLVQILRERYPQDELGELANRELGRIDSLLGQMLRLAAPAPIQYGPVEVHQVLAYTLRLLQTQLVAKRITVKTSWEATPDRVHGCEAQLQQVLMNLVLNAIDAMECGGTLTIATAPGGLPERPSFVPELSLQLRDTGCGMPPETLARLFSPFFTTKTGGTGLGLHIARRIIEDHQGRIEVKSSPGHGTTFTIFLPLCKVRSARS